MAYLHCHNCDFSQDDFWSWGFYWRGFSKRHWIPFRWRYNPISCFIEDLMWLWKPRRLKFDDYAARDFGFKRSDPHSWYMIVFELKKMCRKFIYQKYWTPQKFYRKKKWPNCPICGENSLDID